MSLPLLLLSTALYIGIAVSSLIEKNTGLGIMFIGYTIGNVGIIIMSRPA